MNPQEVDSIARDLGIKPEIVREMESRLSGHDLAFDGGADDTDDARQIPAGYLPDQRYDPAVAVEEEDWGRHNTKRLRAALEGLDPRSRDILARRRLAEEKVTLQELADQYGVSAERIRQLEKNAIAKLRAALET